MANPYYENASRQKFEQRDPTQCVQEENVVLAFRPKEVRLACSDRYQQEGVRHDKQIAFLKQKQVGATSSLVARVLLCFMDRWDGGDLDYIRARACRCSGQR